jgi:hypothetical protein
VRTSVANRPIRNDNTVDYIGALEYLLLLGDRTVLSLGDHHLLSLSSSSSSSSFCDPTCYSASAMGWTRCYPRTRCETITPLCLSVLRMYVLVPLSYSDKYQAARKAATSSRASPTALIGSHGRHPQFGDTVRAGEAATRPCGRSILRHWPLDIHGDSYASPFQSCRPETP